MMAAELQKVVMGMIVKDISGLEAANIHFSVPKRQTQFVRLECCV
jgi:hypothetical protein